MIHTSDWHLGRSFHQVGLLGAQAPTSTTSWRRSGTRQVDAVLVSGDVYDRAMPSPETVELLSEAVRLVDAGATVVLSRATTTRRSGSASPRTCWSGPGCTSGRRWPTSGARSSWVASRSTPSPTSSRPWRPSPGGHRSAPTPACCGRRWAGCARTSRAPGPHGRHGARLRHRRRHERLRARHRGRGRDAVPPDLFAGVAYVALGHLHGRQEVAPGVRYCGSPVAMSFSEWRHARAPGWSTSPAPSRWSSGSKRRSSGRWPAARGPRGPPRRSRTPSCREAWFQVTLTDPRPRWAPWTGSARGSRTPWCSARPAGRAGHLGTYRAAHATRDPSTVLRLPRPRARGPARHRRRARAPRRGARGVAARAGRS